MARRATRPGPSWVDLDKQLQLRFRAAVLLLATMATDARFYEAKARYSWPMDRVDTNNALQIATQLMTVAGVDVARLNRECVVQIDLPDPEGFIRKHFFPDYWVAWWRPGEARLKNPSLVK